MKEDKLAPKRRFKEFENDGAWEQRKLGEIADIFDGTHQTPKYTTSGVKFVSVENIDDLETEKYISQEAYDWEYAKKPAEKGDILMTRIGDIGTAKVIETDETLAYYVTLALLKPKGIDSNFLSNAIESSEVQKDIWERTLHIAFPKKINLGEINLVSLMLPKAIEQKKIGDFFNSLDNLITLHQRKLKKLKETKSAYLSEMFPKEGEVYPKRRFDGFTDPWEQRKLGEVLKTESFRPYLKEPEADGKYKIIQQGDNPLVGYANGEPYCDYEKIVLFGDHTLSLYKPKSPFFISTDGVKLLYGTNNLYGNFLLYLLENYKPKTEGYKRYYSILKDQYGYLASNINEQQKIGVFFMKLDNLITLHQRKLEKLENLKKAYLNEMFV